MTSARPRGDEASNTARDGTTGGLRRKSTGSGVDARNLRADSTRDAASRRVGAAASKSPLAGASSARVAPSIRDIILDQLSQEDFASVWVSVTGSRPRVRNYGPGSDATPDGRNTPSSTSSSSGITDTNGGDSQGETLGPPRAIPRLTPSHGCQEAPRSSVIIAQVRSFGRAWDQLSVLKTLGRRGETLSPSVQVVGILPPSQADWTSDAQRMSFRGVFAIAPTSAGAAVGTFGEIPGKLNPGEVTAPAVSCSAI